MGQVLDGESYGRHTRMIRNVLHLLDVSPPIVSGYSTRSQYIILNQRKLGLNPFAVTSPHHPCNSKEEIIKGIRYFRTSISASQIIASLPIFTELYYVDAVCNRILEIAKSNHIDIIHAHSPSLLGLSALRAARKLNLKVVYEIRAFWEDAATASEKYSARSLKYRAVRSLESYICRKSDHVVTISQAMKRDLISRKVPNIKVSVVPNGVDISSFEPEKKNAELLSALGLEDKFIFGYIGTFYDFEGIYDLLDTFDKLHDQEKNAVLVLVGGGETENAIRGKLKELNVDYIKFLGKVPHEKVLDYYALMDVMIYPRKSTRVTEMTTPLKPLEAMALGKPVICSSVGGLVELVGKENGLFFPPENYDILVNCCRMLMHDPVMRKELGTNGKERAINERSWDKIVKKYVGVYDSI
jgi:PEP-CTERM/exosortase A-associated glycosyltransferase